MGANATTFVPAYVSGEVLTAADLTVTNSGIPVFADSTARDNSFGGTGEKVLAEGQFAYLESTNVTQYYDGAAWQSVGTTPGLVFITGASFSAVASVSLPTNTFSATYKNYKLIFSVTDCSANNINYLRYRAAGSDLTTGYFSSSLVFTDQNTTSNIVVFNQAQATIGYQITASRPNFYDMTLYNPLSTADEIIMSYTGASGVAAYNAGGVVVGTAMRSSGTAIDSLTVYPSTGTITGEYKVYGYSNS
jgi:hypothetical protein